ncbi:MAG: MerR family transcriptional regulator [Zoogloeaceae bacterium]|jgi:DNA-binding transcriptional MerR regulator|nr:MerR family transcriptional regulator [Zoogloeaceae bacterium]
MSMTISEVGKKYGLTPDTLRYYERIGLIPAVGRGAGGIRQYTEFDHNWIDFIKCMRGAGVQVEALIAYVALFQQGDATVNARKQILIEQRAQIAARLADMQKMLDRLDQKIAQYENTIMPVERKLQEKGKPAKNARLRAKPS